MTLDNGNSDNFFQSANKDQKSKIDSSALNKHSYGAIVFLLCAFHAISVAAKPRSGILSSDFDGKPAGARYIGLGETGAAVSGMPESPVWNPACLTDLTESLFSADFDVARHSQIEEEIILKGMPLGGRKLTYLGFAAPNGAFFYRPLADFKNKEITDASDPDNNFIQNNLSISQFGFSSSSEGDRGSVVGINLSYLYGRRGYAVAASGQPPVFDMADGNGFSLDMGFLVKKDLTSFGLVFFNIPGIIYWNEYRPDQLPVVMRAGASLYPVPVFGIVTDYEKRYYRNGMPKPDFLHLGMEMTVLPWLQVRSGAYGEDLNDVDKTIYTAGFTVASSRSHKVDFAMRAYRVQREKVYNYFISIILPLPEGVAPKRSSSSPVSFPKKPINPFGS